MSESNGHVTYDWLTAYKPPLPTEVHVRHWGKAVWIRRLSAGEYDRLATTTAENERRFAAIAHALCKDADGAPLFDKPFMLATDHAINLISRHDREAIDEIWDAFVRINGLGDKDTAKNSPATESDGSASS